MYSIPKQPFINLVLPLTAMARLIAYHAHNFKWQMSVCVNCFSLCIPGCSVQVTVKKKKWNNNPPHSKVQTGHFLLRGTSEAFRTVLVASCKKTPVTQAGLWLNCQQHQRKKMFQPWLIKQICNYSVYLVYDRRQYGNWSRLIGL